MTEQTSEIPSRPAIDTKAELLRIAHGAAEAMNRELATAAANLVDLLELADAAGAEDQTHDILNFCGNHGLSVLQNAVDNPGEHASALHDLCQQVNIRWGEYLSLVADEDRFQTQLESEHAELFSDAWNDFHLTNDSHADLNDADDPVGQIDVGSLLSSLEAITASVPSVPQSPETPAAHPMPAPEPGDEIDPELLAAYIDDAQQCLSGMESSLLQLESGDQQQESLRQFCRELHTLKGASGIVGLDKLATYLHELETYVEDTTHNSRQPDVDTLLGGVDAVRTQLNELTASDGSRTASESPAFQIPAAAAANPAEAGRPAPVENPPTSTEAPGPVASSAASGTGEQYVRIEASRLDRMLDLLAELVMLRNRRDTHIGAIHSLEHELGGCANRIRLLESSLSSAARHDDQAVMEESGIAEHDARPESHRQHARSLIELSQDVSELGRSLREVRDPLSDDNSSVSRLIGEFRQELMELRRLPIAGLFERLRRVVRDAARTEGKQVELEFEGQGTRAERSLQEQLFEPLMHLVRNAVSHGIDTPEARQAASKSPAGKITLAAWSDSATVFIEVRDDGRGLNETALAARGRELGLLAPGHQAEQEDLWKLIFHPGFSTRSEVSEISGRGVGMDVVDNWIRRLRGHVEVRSQEGLGTTFRLQIPLRSAIEHAMVVRAGGQLFAVPMQAVARTSAHRDDAIPTRAVALRNLLGMDHSTAPQQCVLALRSTNITETQTPQSPETLLAVDAVVGVEEVVIRALPAMLMRHRLFAGITLSGQAETVLLLDVPRLLESARHADVSGTTDIEAEASHHSARQRGTVLVVDDSITVRKSLVRRLQAGGYRTLESPDGKDALKVLRSERVEAVISDIDMPRMDGFELLAEIRSLSKLSDVPVVVSTSRNDPETLSRLNDLNARRVFHKPLTESDFAELLFAIQQPVAV